MLRDVAIVGAAVLILQAVNPSAQAAAAPEGVSPGASMEHASLREKPRHAFLAPSEKLRHTASFHIASIPHIRKPVHIAARAPASPLAGSTELSDQEEEVTELAERNGDKNFLMVDKAHGKIILFENDEPVFSGPALTGESTADELPPGALKQKFAMLSAVDTKVTPAGRYTVSRTHDDDYGTVLDINEIKGTDWGIAIHKIYLGTPSEHRAERIQSPNEADKHITFGCINVTPDAIQFLLHELPEKGATPLYILPEDETRTVTFFEPRTS